ncbi:MAG: ATP-binding protein [Hyphomonas sp.]|uniref:sensor histidine kinase n=1 Tax=Hyphomonas sp. TaxID=87 RepID=UPI0034A065D5
MSEDANRRSMTRRTRDFTVLLGTTGTVLLLLVATSALGPVEAISALGVIASVGVAYFVGSAARVPQGISDTRAEPAAAPQAEAGPGLLAALALPALEIGPGQKIMAFNRAAEDLFQLANLPFARASAVIRSPVLLAAIDQALERPAAGPVSAEIETGPDETWRAHVSRIPDGRHVLVLMEDLTPVKRAARARADFLANASHELRTPLTAISGFIETMRGPARDDAAAWPRFLDIMAGESDRMSRLIADLLSLSRIESSEHVLPRGRENLAEIVSACLAVLEPIAGEQGAALKVAGASTGLPEMTAHRDELIQVVENLVSNAVKYSKSGSTITLSFGAAPSLAEARLAASQQWDVSQRMTLLQALARSQGAEPAVWLRVEDQGPGIEREHLPRLGERFYRADQSRGGKITGTGLGLAIVKHIMAHHRGGLAVETLMGQGSAFGVWMPTGRE